MLTTDVADGVHQLTRGSVNCYLIEDESGLTLVDAGLPAFWLDLTDALRHLRRDLDQIRAVVITHGHFDHVGLAARLQRESKVKVFVHVDDGWLTAHPYRYRPARNRVLFALTHPGSLPHLKGMVAAGALRTHGTAVTATFRDDDVLPVPGWPRVLHTPGHTRGHSAFVLSDRGVIFTGDALVTLDPYTGHRGPRVVAGAGTEDPAAALDSLGRITGSGARIVLPGHGVPWTGDLVEACDRAREGGVA